MLTSPIFFRIKTFANTPFCFILFILRSCPFTKTTLDLLLIIILVQLFYDLAPVYFLYLQKGPCTTFLEITNKSLEVQNAITFQP